MSQSVNECKMKEGIRFEFAHLHDEEFGLDEG
jgi:hypothetical protein